MIDKLEMFIALAREEHFGRAAESLGITQPTLSAGIKQLEGQLGVMLVWRSSRFGGLTPEGQRVLHWARRIVGDTRTLREEMRAARHGLSGDLRLAIIPTALTVAAGLTVRFSRAHPNVRFTIRSQTSIEILAMIENLQVDAGISYLDNEPLGQVTAVPLYRETYRWVCREDHPLADRAEIAWEDLAGLPLCLLTPDMQNRRIVNQNLYEAGIAADAAIQSNSTVVIMAHVEAGDWGTILPRQLAEFLAVGRPLRVIPMRAIRPPHSVGLIAPYREPHTPILEALVQMSRSISDVGEAGFG
ncbi:LysR family transcriptional regulator [Amaricoccus sp.]|uniref:LysR family transcriptional regulator n=1 Tax=Amaricoccus sp. TaxID=1872485 RepID=UPI00260842C8|nr:LysR family transcriptional regulator [Amaricoccus sp.]HRO09950.1 LysR family transcriptional regulator [Amaricoccus sp.]